MSRVATYTPVRSYPSVDWPDPAAVSISSAELEGSDDQIGAVTDAVNALGTAADHAVADFDTSGAAASAQSAAATDATTKANAAQAASISAAATDATTKANGAQAAAISAAATDATTKANAATASALQKASNLSDLGSASAGRTALGLGTAATMASGAFDTSGAAAAAQAASLQKSSNLSDIGNAATALANLGGVAASAVAQIKGARVYVEDQGAKGDGKAFDDAAMTASSATLTSASSAFVLGDVGKVVQVAGAGTSGVALLTTISAFTNGTTVTLTAAAVTTVTGAHAIYGTDDTTAINAAITAAVSAAQSSGSNMADVCFQAKRYMIGGALVQGGSTLGNAQIPLPVIPMTSHIVTLRLIGAGEASALPHWLQTAPQRGGTVLCTTVAGTNHATFGEATMIGGPNKKQGYGSATNVWNNMQVVIDGITLSLPKDPQISGFDLQGTAESYIKSAAVMTNQDVPHYVRSTTATWQFGYRMPDTNNQSVQIIDRYTAEGCCYGLMVGEHCNASGLYLFYNVVALQCVNTTTMPHSCWIAYANCEGNTEVLQNDSGSPFNINIACLDIENVSGYGTTRFISDDSNHLRGEIRFTQPSSGGSSPLPFGSTQISGGTGATQVRIIDLTRISGAVASPTVPATTVALRNTYWRDATVYITGASVTAIAVDGATLGITSGMVRVPSGKNITLTYSVAPTWVWTLD